MFLVRSSGFLTEIKQICFYFCQAVRKNEMLMSLPQHCCGYGHLWTYPKLIASAIPFQCHLLESFRFEDEEEYD